MSKKKKPEPCEHILLQIISFHKKDFCISYACTKCDHSETIRNIPYTKLDGQYGVLVEDEKPRMPMKLNFDMIPEFKRE